MAGRRRAWWSWLSAKRRHPPTPLSEASLGGVATDSLIILGIAGERRVPWSVIERIVAVSRAGYVGDTALLIIELSDGNTFVVSEGDPHRPALVAALDTALANTISSLVWQLRLLGAPDLPVEVYRRSGDMES